MNSHMRSAAEVSEGNMTSSNSDVMVQEFVLAFDDLERDPGNHRKLMDCVRSYYANSLNAPEFCSALRRRLTTDHKLTHHQPVNDSFAIQNFYSELSGLYTDHSAMEEMLKSMEESFASKLSSVGASRKRHSVFFTAAAMFCAAAAAILAGNAIHNMSSARTWIAAVAAAFSILFAAIGKWRQSVLKKDEVALKKHKQITKYMIMGAQHGMEYTKSIHNVARKLDTVSESLSGTVYDWKKVAAVENSLTELQRKDEEYSDGMKWVKQLVIESIVKPFG
ncbi:hypothetical protein AAHA92_26340 [Salvia divinorum]|uniref:Uncharacterized protein n=1 Tax=Salvia divinorum TaxID=28513 RepID=A0ABD1GG80_SALDI